MRNVRRFLALATVLLALGAAPRAVALEGFYLGGSVGYVGLTGNGKIFDNGLGFGADIGAKVNSYVNLLYHFQYSSHKNFGDLQNFANFLTADFQLVQMNDIFWSIGGGPGLYLLKAGGTTNTNFGLNASTDVGLNIDEKFRVGVGFRYHVIFSPTVGDNYYTIMASVGYTFGD